MEISTVQEVFKESSFTMDELQTLGNSLQQIDLKKGDSLLRAGETVLHTYYVYNGCLRSFFIDEAGKDHTLQFAIKDWWISDYKPSSMLDKP
jgi:CRP-like cAMP-binding protein